ncbi:kelch domain-containing protein 4 [Orussus abietinus]|uniref:kelch domain-containing protein 4 n=1 Tax=Orussus abietinus TaxID=222816 RepID=UPI0006268E3A|nr:kelch domain-containing protein 4 [Orussus abietinus]
MGKKEKNKKKVSGSVKTALKTEKKLSAKQKKELAALGEDDIAKVIADIEKEEARRQRVVEVEIDPPSRRVNFTITAHPFKDEIIMLGGEFFDGQKTVVYGDMFFYNLNKRQWTVVKAPGAPPPRCGHQTIAVPSQKGELWVFGGEFSSPSESQFYHYKDLWLYHMGDKKWEKVVAPGGPTARSGHRMVYAKKQIFVFGGFHDNLRDYKYYNDLYIFNLETYKWNKIDTTGNCPTPRSGCVMLPIPEGKILVYGGYNKERIKKDVDKGEVHTDMFVLSPEKNDSTGLKWKWALVKQTGVKPSPRCGISATLVQPNLAYLFGGVFDEEDDEEELRGTSFYNDMMTLDLDLYRWQSVKLSGARNPTSRSRRRKPKEGESMDENTEEMDTSSEVEPMVLTDEDGIFTVTVDSSTSIPVAGISDLKVEESEAKENWPSPRMNAGLCFKHGILYLYGGMAEDGSRQYTLNDLHSLDCRKLDEWRTVIKDDLSSQVWIESSSSDSDEDTTSEEDDDHDDDE